MNKRFGFVAEIEDRGKRADEFLSNRLPELSRVFIKHLFRDGVCEINGFTANRGVKMRQADFLEVEFERRESTTLIPEPIDLEIIFEDAELLIVNKPTKMLVHPSFKIRTGSLFNGLLHYLGTDARPGLVHRLDKDTSGLVVVAKNKRSHRILCSHFQRRLVKKRYIAVVEGVVKENSGDIHAPIGRDAETRFWSVREDGKPAHSRFMVIQRGVNETILELEPVTGRTNQLRIHCEKIGHPIRGDEKYGAKEFERLCLHARELEFWHPNGERRLHFKTETPPHFDLISKNARL